MGKKSFKGGIAANAFISGNKSKDTREVQDVQEVKDEKNTDDLNKLEGEEVQEKEKPKKHPTQGKKGKKLPRINMAFSEDNIEYLRLMSRFKGISRTEFINRLLEEDREKNGDIIDRLKDLMEGE